MHVPAWHVSVCVHALPSLHALPSDFAGLEQVPVAGLHVPATWHWSWATQTTPFMPVQVPAWQVSVCVHALPSLHGSPFGAAGFEHVPVAWSHVPATWHWSCAVQTTGLAPTQLPATHVSVWVQAFPSLHPVPSGAALCWQTPVASQVSVVHGSWSSQSAFEVQLGQKPPG